MDSLKISRKCLVSNKKKLQKTKVGSSHPVKEMTVGSSKRGKDKSVYNVLLQL